MGWTKKQSSIATAQHIFELHCCEWPTFPATPPPPVFAQPEAGSNACWESKSAGARVGVLVVMSVDVECSPACTPKAGYRRTWVMMQTIDFSRKSLIQDITLETTVDLAI